MEIRDYVQLFKEIVNQYPEIKGFYMMDINEILNKSLGGIQYPALILEPISGQYLQTNPDNTIEVIFGGFSIIDLVVNVDDFQKEVQVLSNMKLLGSKIIQKIYENSSCDSFKIKEGSVSFETIGPVMNNGFGFLFLYSII